MIQFDHEKTDVYTAALEYAVWAFSLASRIGDEHRHARSQLLLESQTVPRCIAEANGRTTLADRQRCLEDAQAFAYGCASIQDILHHCGAVSEPENQEGKLQLQNVVTALAKMTEGGARPARRTDVRHGRLTLPGHDQEEHDTVFMPAPSHPGKRQPPGA